MRWTASLLLIAFGAFGAEAPVQFAAESGALRINVGAQTFARYVFEDALVRRPYFCDVHAPNGVEVTRNNPPVEGVDDADHADFHPGIWMAFGDINGVDFWRNKGTVKHTRFVEEPSVSGTRGTFAVENVYLAPDGKEVCRETARYAIEAKGDGIVLRIDTVFESSEHDVVFGDQEEMGLGVRMATSMTVKNGGTILNSEGGKNEAGVWGKTAAWCAYQGSIGGKMLGVCLMPHPDTFRPSWFHARDYGLLVANAFGRNAFTEAEKSAVVVKRGERFRLRFGVYVYAGGEGQLPAAYATYLSATKSVPADR